jgi:hypothetical protein
MKHKLIILLSAVTFFTLGSGSMLAHHSSTAVYIQAKTVKIEGTLKEFLWRNPHSFIKVEAPDDKGEMQLWVIEGAAPTQLTESGMTRTTLRPGDHVVATGHPGRVAEDHRMVLLTLERPSDGWKLKTDRAALLENDGERTTK